MNFERFYTIPLLSSRKGGFIGDLIGWFIRIVIYDICISTIQEVTGFSRIVSLFIFLGILAALSFGFYILKNKTSPGVDDPS